MPSFLSKVFNRKKDEKTSPKSPRHGSGGSLLDGKFEAVSPTVSPSVANFPENELRGGAREKGKEQDGAFNLFKVRSRPSSPEASQKKKDDLPQLSLVLPVSNEETQAALGVAFEADPATQILNDAAIGNRRLDPSEALILVRACSQAIITRGLETLGLMHPHWYSASPDAQRKLISLFIHSLNSKNAITTSSPNLSLPTSLFESEVSYTRSPHDIAAVLRWGLRHLELGGSRFGKEESWYMDFAQSERNADYPPKAYSEKLAPLVPQTHLELLNTTLDLFSSLASHAESNGTSSSRLTKTFGFWLLATPRAEENDDWSTFYGRWQRNGRILEHLFLARIRDEALRVRMPTRLMELVTHYPYIRGSSIENDTFLHPRLSTRHFDALFVRIETEFSSSQDKVRRHPLQLIKDAFGADVIVEGNDYSRIWEKLRVEDNQQNPNSPGSLSHIFADETIRYLTLVSGEHPLKKVASPTFSITEISHEVLTPRRHVSSPVGGSHKPANGTSNGHAKPATDPSPLPSAAASPLDTDWSLFSSTGFSDVSPTIVPLASTLFGQDVEKTNPPFRKSSRRSKVPSPTRSLRKSLDVGPSHISTPPQPEAPAQPEIPKLTSKAIPLSLVQIDEAFIEFWVDALLDPISSNWPTFILCKLKSSLPDLTVNDKRIEYLVLEQAFVPKPPPTPVLAETTETIETVEPDVTPEKTTASSPKSSVKSEKRFFGFFTTSGRSNSHSSDKVSGTTSKGKKRVSPRARVTELGEVVKEEDEKLSSTVKLRIPSPKPRKSADATRKSIDARRKSADISCATEGDIGKFMEPIGKKERLVDDVAAAAVATGVVAVGAAAATTSVESGQPTVPSDVDAPKPTEDTVKIAESPEVTAVPVVLAEAAPKAIAIAEVDQAEEPTASIASGVVEQHALAGVTIPAASSEQPTQEPSLSTPAEDVSVVDVTKIGQLNTIPEEPLAEVTPVEDPSSVMEAALIHSEPPAKGEEPTHGPGLALETTPVVADGMIGTTALVEEPATTTELDVAPEESAAAVEEPTVEDTLVIEESAIEESSLNIGEDATGGTAELTQVEEPTSTEGVSIPEETPTERLKIGETQEIVEPVQETPVGEKVVVESPAVAEEHTITEPAVEEPEVAEVVTPLVEGGATQATTGDEEAVVTTEGSVPVEAPSVVEEPLVIGEPVITDQTPDDQMPGSVEELAKVEETTSVGKLIEEPASGPNIEETTVGEPAKESAAVEELLQEPLAEEKVATELAAAGGHATTEEPGSTDETLTEVPVQEPSIVGEVILEKPSAAEEPVIEIPVGEPVEVNATEVTPEKLEVAAGEPVLELGTDQEHPAFHQQVAEPTSEPVLATEETHTPEISTAVQDGAASTIPEPEYAPAVADEELVPEDQPIDIAPVHVSEALPEPVPEAAITPGSTSEIRESILVATAAPTEPIAEANMTESNPEPGVVDKDGPVLDMLESSGGFTTSPPADNMAGRGQEHTVELTATTPPAETATNEEATSASPVNGNGHYTPEREKDNTDHEIPSVGAPHNTETTPI